MSLEVTRHKLDWLRGLKGIRQRRLRDCMDKRDWPENDIETKRRDIAMIDRIISDYERVLDRQTGSAT